MSNIPDKRTLLESWPMIREDFDAFTQDPTCWFIDRFEKAAGEKDWEAINKLIDIFKIINRAHEGHSH